MILHLEALAAGITLKLMFNVLPFVAIEAEVSLECHVALITLVRTIVGVISYVPPQETHLSKFLATVFTLELKFGRSLLRWLLSGLKNNFSLEIRVYPFNVGANAILSEADFFVTYLTNIHAIRMGSSLVIGQISANFVSFPTSFADI